MLYRPIYLLRSRDTNGDLWLRSKYKRDEFLFTHVTNGNWRMRSKFTSEIKNMFKLHNSVVIIEDDLSVKKNVPKVGK